MSDGPDAPALREADMPRDPIEKFREWFEAAGDAGHVEPTAMTLATADDEGRPSARVVLLKEFDAEGFVFYTNYDSRKGAELAANPQASLVFWWDRLARQVRIEGAVEKVADTVSDEYFRSRPRNSQLAAWASRQSAPVPDRAALESRFESLAREHAGREVPRPPFWGGYRLRPRSIEFWQGRGDRLHDRFRYRIQEGRWILERLAP